MSKSKNPGRAPLCLTSYAELRRFGGAFAAGHLNLLIVTGGPGLGKSRLLKELVGDRASWVDGHVTPFGMYVKLFESRDQPLVIDDVDGMHADQNCVRLLKGLCQSDREKQLSWNSRTRQLDELGIPHRFSTTSKTAIIANDWQRLNLDVEALEDRGHVVHFQPSAREVHRHAAEWFLDQEVFDFLGSRLSWFAQPSFRHYTSALELKNAGLDWKQATLARGLAGKPLVVAQLKADDRYETEEQRAQALVAAGHGCRATYFNVSRKLPPPVEAPPLVLETTAPPATSAAEPESAPEAASFDVLDLLRRRHGELGHG